MQTSDKNEPVAPPPWAQKARRVSRWMLYAAGVLLLLGLLLIWLGTTISVRPPVAGMTIADEVMKVAFIGGLGVGLIGIVLRSSVLIVGYSRFTLKGMLSFVITLGAGGACMVNGWNWVGLLLIIGAVAWLGVFVITTEYETG